MEQGITPESLLMTDLLVLEKIYYSNNLELIRIAGSFEDLED